MAENCENGARSQITASSTAIAFCERRVAKDQACGISTKSEQCVDEEKVLVDGVFPLLSDCLARDCDQYMRCMAGVFINPEPT